MRMDDLKELSRKRDVVEAEINSLVSFLQEQGFHLRFRHHSSTRFRCAGKTG